jgi:hypothetical protein
MVQENQGEYESQWAAMTSIRVTVGGDDLDCGEGWLHSRDIAEVGASA